VWLTCIDLRFQMRMRASSEDLRIVVGSSADASRASEIAMVINEAYGYERTDSREIQRRVQCGDFRGANRVLHIAYRGDRFVGCISSTPHWDGTCGQWGFLAVAVDEQASGVGSALVRAAEERLVEHGCTHAQIEYVWEPCRAKGSRLNTWYSQMGFKPTAGSCLLGVFCCLCMSAQRCSPAVFRISRSVLTLFTEGIVGGPSVVTPFAVRKKLPASTKQTRE